MLGIVNFLLAQSARAGYFGIVFLMAIESSFIPFPSEVIIPPAAYLAAQGQFNIYLIILFGIIGSLTGALLNYFLALTLGRKIVYALARTKVAKALFINEKKIEQSELYFLKYGNLSTFLGRLLPAVRQLISIPAGFSRMSLFYFILYTGLGSGLWIAILAALGYAFGSNQAAVSKYYREISYTLLFIVAAIVVYLILKKRKNNRKKELN